MFFKKLKKHRIFIEKQRKTKEKNDKLKK